MRARLVILLVLGGMGCSGADGPASDPSATDETVAEPETPEGPEGSGEAPSEPSAAAEPETPPAADHADDADEGAEGDLCTRARACCRAYVSAIPSARRPLEERGCAEMDAVLGEAGEAADDVCEAAIGGWRQSLQLTGIEVPASCQ